MSPTSYQLLYPAMFGNAKVENDFYKSKFFFRIRIVVNRERIEMVEEITYANLLLDTKEEFWYYSDNFESFIGMKWNLND